MDMVTTRQALRHAAETLMERGFEEGRLEAEILLSRVLGITRNLVQRRLRYEPVAYITGVREFFGLEFRVTPDTLIPRPETELLVDKSLEAAASRSFVPRHIADIGTGCGAVAVTLALQLPEAEVYAVDISPRALEVAGENTDSHGVSARVRLLQGDLLQPLPQMVDIIVANLPYVRDREMSGLGKDIRGYEPELALAGGPDGLVQIGRLLDQVEGRLRPGGVVLLEIGEGQLRAVTELAGEFLPGACVEAFRDLAGVYRVVVIDTAG